MNKKVVIHGKKRVFDGFFKLDEVQVSYERFNGQMSPVLPRLSFERGDSVAAMVFNVDTRKLIFVNQFKYPTYEKGPGWITETVAGIIDEGESPDVAIRREVLEETGYHVSHLEPIATFYVSPGGSSERIVLYYAEVTAKDQREAGGGMQCEGEDITTVELTVDDARDQIANGEIADAKSIIGILWFLSRVSSQ